MKNHDNIDDQEPTEEELKEIEKLLNEDEAVREKEHKSETKQVNRRSYLFKTESHWSGWLRIHGIKW